MQAGSKVSGRGGRREGGGSEVDKKGSRREKAREKLNCWEGEEEKGVERREKNLLQFIEYFCNTFPFLSLSHAVPDCLRVCLSDWSVLE